MKQNRKFWTISEERVLRGMATDHPDAEIAQALGRTTSAVAKRRKELRIRGYNQWTDKRRDEVRQMSAAGRSIADIAEAMGRSWWSIEQQLRKMGIAHGTADQPRPGTNFFRRDSDKMIERMMELAGRCA